MLAKTSLLTFVLLAAPCTLAGCASNILAAPCSTSTDCVATRQCVDGRCVFVDSGAHAADASGGHDAGDAGALDTGPGGDGGHDGGSTAPDAAIDAGQNGGGDAGRTDAGAADVGVDAAQDGGHDASIDGGCALGPCCLTTATDAACGVGFVCRPPPSGEEVGSCVACDASSGVVCGTLGGGVVQTFPSECEAFAAGADVVGRGACHCGVAGVSCGGGQICDRGVRHLRDCASAAPEGICVAPSTPSCDVIPRREITCDDATTFDDECQRLSTTGGGVMTRYAISCVSVPPTSGCYDDRDCTRTGTSCYGARDCLTGGACMTDPAPGHCIDDTDCTPWQACTLGACVDAR